MKSFQVADIVGLLGLEKDPKTPDGAVSFNVRCPFCSSPSQNKYHLNINTQKNVFYCFKCQSGKGMNALDLYAMAKYGRLFKDCTDKRSIFRELGEDDDSYYKEKKGKPEVKTQTVPTQYHDILPAEDSVLHKTYSTLLGLPYLALTQEHKDNLIARGLDEDAITRNQYRSMSTDWVESHPKYPMMLNVWNRNRLGLIKESMAPIKKLPKLKLIAGLIIASDIIERKAPVANTPGFFKFGPHWCFKIDDGMIIPTRNIMRQIVSMQVRTDAEYKQGLRYLTVSSKGLPEGPTTNIARIHFPMDNSKLREEPKVVITEGPLKADVAAFLKPSPMLFLALQGVNNTKELSYYCPLLKKHNVDIMFNGLDMDKLININVAKASDNIDNILQSHGIQCRMLVWDKEYAESVEKHLQRLCALYGIEYLSGRANPNMYSRVIDAVKKLNSKGVDLKKEFRILTNTENLWPDRSKGIDDYFKYLKQEEQ